jgi:hypothetical protein
LGRVPDPSISFCVPTIWIRWNWSEFIELFLNMTFKSLIGRPNGLTQFHQFRSDFQNSDQLDFSMRFNPLDFLSFWRVWFVNVLRGPHHRSPYTLPILWIWIETNALHMMRSFSSSSRQNSSSFEQI